MVPLAQPPMTFRRVDGQPLTPAKSQSQTKDSQTTPSTSGSSAPEESGLVGTRTIIRKTETADSSPDNRPIQRAAWAPRNIKDVILSGCGHIGFPDCVITSGLSTMVQDTWCPECKEWRPIHREATAFERAGIKIEQTELPQDPTF